MKGRNITYLNYKRIEHEDKKMHNKRVSGELFMVNSSKNRMKNNKRKKNISQQRRKHSCLSMAHH